jgi:hypothetical protein
VVELFVVLDHIRGARITQQTFTPRYMIELTPSGPLTLPPSASRAGCWAKPGVGRHGSHVYQTVRCTYFAVRYATSALNERVMTRNTTASQESFWRELLRSVWSL